jgi:hypothetical protein
MTLSPRFTTNLKPIDISERALGRLLEGIARLAAEDDDWSPEGSWPGLQIVLSSNPTGRVLFLTKLSGLLGVDLDKLTSRVSILTRYGVLSRAYVQCIARACPRRQIEFIGDLDPLDLTAYLSLAVRLRAFGKRICYSGVDDSWIERCRRHALKPGYLPVIPMTNFEKKQFALLKTVGVVWEEIVGVQGLELLNRGVKLELEGATNPAFYSPKFTAELESAVFAAERARPSARKRKRRGE